MIEIKKKFVGLLAVLTLAFGIGLGVDSVNSIDSSDPPGAGGFRYYDDPTPTEPTEPIEEPTI
jgi:hypothetical protein